MKISPIPFLIAFIIIASLFSCKSPQAISTETTHRIDSVYTIEKPVLINVPGSTIQTQSINIDSLVNLIRSGIPQDQINKSLSRSDPKTGLQIGILIDELGNLTALCVQQDRMIKSMEREINRLTQITNTKETTTVKGVSFWAKIGNAFLVLLGVLFLAYTVVTFIRIAFKLT